ncbi:MAG: hypothetical protein DRQ89_12000 [Epsilonproteobacteria bacterium]|nr:MAG: hypothetical protein DRQ89_12000 [Campylobacterota bacterium]
MKKGILLVFMLGAITLLITNCGKGGKQSLKAAATAPTSYQKAEGPINNFVIPANSISEDELWNGLYKGEDGFCSTNIERRRLLGNFFMLQDLDIRLFSALPYHGKNSSGLALPTACEDSTLKNFYLVGEENVPLVGNPYFKDYLITGQCFEFASVLWPDEGLKLADKNLYIVAEGEDVEGKVKYLNATQSTDQVFCEELLHEKQTVFEVPGIDGKIVFVQDGIYQYDEGDCYPLFDIISMKDSPSISPKSLMGVLSIKSGKREIDFFFIKGKKTYILPYLPHLGALDFEDWSEEISSPRC